MSDDNNPFEYRSTKVLPDEASAQLVWVVARHDTDVEDCLDGVDVFVHPSEKLAEEWATHWSNDDRYLVRVYTTAVVDTSPSKQK
jgi:hypothetical protein